MQDPPHEEPHLPSGKLGSCGDLIAAVPKLRFLIYGENLHKLLVVTNYSAWKYRLIQLLKAEGVWQLVEDGPVDGTAQAANNQAEDQRALLIISLTIDDQEIKHISGCKSARDAWFALRNTHDLAHRPKDISSLVRDVSDMHVDFNSWVFRGHLRVSSG
ncbi:hypothetical protein BJ508DRAFT_303672 [Ascobolus immersus RN42]|uniref:Uncharacterized protein n=1 Tax=Ascobolus immersus RN42 TaxID=1160509 RepID=A0A3N4IEM8_ASCIM|nr:hypothetical protein BJ508DRAFT_303672 [Ascobolus immersus RN42]